jgi:outer membrane protein assembly factor BamB
MKKGLLFFAALTSATLYAQQYVHQVLIANEGYFDFQTNNIVEPATIGTYNPQTQTYQVANTLAGQRFSSDVIIDGNFYFVAADTKIYKFDLNTHQEVGIISLPGVRNLAISGNKLIATRGEYLQTFDSYLQVFDKNTLQLIAALDTNNGPKWATQNIVVVNNTAYVAVNKAYEWGNEKGLIGQLNLNTLQYGSEIDLGAEEKYLPACARCYSKHFE